MAEYIKRKDALDMHFSVGLQDGSTQYVRYTEVKDNIKHIPTADVVEVVHCKDCIYALGKVNKNNVICNKQDWATTWREDDYCSDGERKEGETT